MSELKTFYYDDQIRRYIAQFMAIFAGMKVEVGKTGDLPEHRLINVPIAYGHKDRVVAHIKSDNTQNSPLRLPAFGAFLTSIELDPSLRKGVNQKRRNTYLPTGGMFPDDIEVVHQIMPVPYRCNMELAIFTSNIDQMHQIMEQIMMLFDPILQIQTSDDVFDWTKLTTVEMVGMRYDDNYPQGPDRRMTQTTIDFSFPMYISAPADVKKDYVKDIYLRIGAVGTDSNSSQEIIADLDSQGIEYKLIFSLDDIDLNA